MRGHVPEIVMPLCDAARDVLMNTVEKSQKSLYDVGGFLVIAKV